MNRIATAAAALLVGFAAAPAMAEAPMERCEVLAQQGGHGRNTECFDNGYHFLGDWERANSGHQTAPAEQELPRAFELTVYHGDLLCQSFNKGPTMLQAAQHGYRVVGQRGVMHYTIIGRCYGTVYVMAR